MESPLVRANFVSRIRKAFLLRAHPDRYRSSENPIIRRQQAVLVQALGERMSQPDFVAYVGPSGIAKQKEEHSTLLFPKSYNFHLAGSPLHNTIRLDNEPHKILTEMRNALERCGVAGLPEMPPPPSVQEQISSDVAWKRRVEADAAMKTGSGSSEFTRLHGIIWAASSTRSGDNKARPQEIDHRFDVNSRRGSSLCYFLRGLNLKDIDELRKNRLDVQTAALNVRTSFGFQAVDGTSMGWSSGSLAMLLSSLTALHDEHKGAILKSFYPMRLLISYDDDSIFNVDLYGGVVRLHPAATPIQWLETLQSITEDSLAELKENQEKLRKNAEMVQDMLNVKLIKGKTCSSPEYHIFVRDFSQWLERRQMFGENATYSKAVALTRLQLVVEADQACRRGRLNNDGTIRVGAGMSGEAIIATIDRLSQGAQKKVIERKQMLERAKEVIALTRNQFGLARVYQETKSTVTLEEMTECLLRLMQTNDVEQSELFKLVGQSLAITGKGHFVHLSDDGSIVIPSDWR